MIKEFGEDINKRRSSTGVRRGHEKIIQGKHYEIVCDFYNTEQAKKIIIAMHGFAGDKESSCIAALRSPALHMSEVMEQILADTCETEEGWITGFDRRILVTKAFRAELKEYDLERLFEGYLFDRNVMILHGDADDLVPYTDSVNFCREYGIRLLTAAGTDHRYKKPGELDRVIDLAERFFTGGTGERSKL